MACRWRDNVVYVHIVCIWIFYCFICIVLVIRIYVRKSGYLWVNLCFFDSFESWILFYLPLFYLHSFSIESTATVGTLPRASSRFVNLSWIFYWYRLLRLYLLYRRIFLLFIFVWCCCGCLVYYSCVLLVRVVYIYY